MLSVSGIANNEVQSFSSARSLTHYFCRSARRMNRNAAESLVSRAPNRFLVTLLALSFAFTTTASAQKDKKKKQADQAQQLAAIKDALPDEQRIDLLISDMLGAWQIGDTERLHKDIADDIVVVNGNWAPPVVGWPEYLKAYQAQRARANQVRLDRSNTLIRVTGSVAWACYQWDFSGIVDGQPSGARGQTTLILEKRNDAWIIVHNHTSIVQTALPATPATATPPAPTAKP
jgi:ketosteroid isomerase-like protein